MRVNLGAFPFSRILITNCVGYYNTDDVPCWTIDANIINVLYKNDELKFDLNRRDLEERFKKINDFTIAPLITAANEKEEAFVRVIKEENIVLNEEVPDASKDSNDCHAPCWALAPIVMECRLVDIGSGFFPTCRATVLDITVADCCLNEQKAFDLMNFWKNSEWKKCENKS